MLRWAVVSVPVQNPDTLLDEHVLVLFEDSYEQNKHKGPKNQDRGFKPLAWRINTRNLKGIAICDLNKFE